MTATQTKEPAAAPATDPAGALLENARALMEDMTFAGVEKWKRENPGGLAIGYMPVYVPRPVLEAQGCLPVAVFGGGDQVDIIRGDSYYQSYICHIPRSTIELALAGNLDVLDGMLFPSICDVIRNLSGMWQMLFPKKLSWYVDLPQNFHPEIGGRFYIHEMGRMAAALEERGARALDDDALLAAIESENTRRAVIAELDALRREQPWLVRASEAYAIIRAGSMLDTHTHTRMLREFLEAARKRQARPYDNVRVVVEGSFCEQPPLGLIVALEKAGCDIIEDDFQLGLRYIEGPLEVRDGEPPLEAMARAFIDQGRATASRYIADEEKGRELIDRVKNTGADGVIFAAASFCDPALLDQPMLEKALDRAEIPYTSFKYAENTGQFSVIREQAGAFSDSVKLWGTVG